MKNEKKLRLILNYQKSINELYEKGIISKNQYNDELKWILKRKEKMYKSTS